MIKPAVSTPSLIKGRTIGLYGESGTGKTTQIGELSKHVFKTTGKRTRYNAGDMGGYGSIEPLERIGILDVNPLENRDPWTWLDDAASGKGIDDTIGLVAFDSGTSNSEALLSSCAHLSAQGTQVGAQKNLRFSVPGERTHVIGANTESHYMVVQSYMLDMIWKSTWLTRRGIDVVWTFSVHRGEQSNDTPILGPKLAGKALTAAIPKWFNYTFRIVSIPVVGEASRHVLYLQEQSEANGLTVSFGNSRYPLDADTPLPASIEPASLTEALRLIEQGKAESEAKLRAELGV